MGGEAGPSVGCNALRFASFSFRCLMVLADGRRQDGASQVEDQDTFPTSKAGPTRKVDNEGLRGNVFFEGNGRHERLVRINTRNGLVDASKASEYGTWFVESCQTLVGKLQGWSTLRESGGRVPRKGRWLAGGGHALRRRRARRLCASTLRVVQQALRAVREKSGLVVLRGPWAWWSSTRERGFELVQVRIRPRKKFFISRASEGARNL